MNALATVSGHEVMERVLAAGDLKNLTPEERNTYYNAVCTSCGLNPLTRPFEYLTLNSKLVLYARRDAADQLRKLHNISLRIVEQRVDGDVFIARTQARMPDGREDEDIGAVTVGALRGEAMANARMKAITKSKRRVTLSICGLGFLDETEVADIPREQRQEWEETAHDVATGEVIQPPKPQSGYRVFDEFGNLWSTCANLTEAITAYGKAKTAGTDKAMVSVRNLDLLRVAVTMAKNGMRAKLEQEIAAAEAVKEQADMLDEDAAKSIFGENEDGRTSSG